ncbi:MAG: hypothetical protein M3Q55_03630 [Acidobacteriota bacterium]|nr:hypothetical protein [Acidobacteriota bacterium]
MADEKLTVEKEVIVATESGGADQKRLGRPMLMLLVLIGVAIAGIGIMVAVLSN